MSNDPQTTGRTGDNWQTWCHVTNSPCTANIPAACFCAQMPTYLAEKLRKGETNDGEI